MLRSSSIPILNSWTPTFKEISSPESDPFIHLTSKTLSRDKISATVNLSSPSHHPHHSRKLPRTLSETSFNNDLPPSPTGPIHRKNPFKPALNSFSTPVGSEELVRPATVMGTILSSNGLMVSDEMRSDGAALDGLLVDGGSEGGRGGSGRRRSEGGGSSGFYENRHDHGNDSNSTADTYYQTMIQANPSNSLLLSNYAKFLTEVSGDYAKAEEYCGRAILANPDDGNALSMYAGLIWRNDKDAERAENYFDQAVKTSPDDCYVLASYANFLWDAEEEDEEGNQGEGQKGQNGAVIDNSLSPSLLKGTLHPSPLTMAS